MKHDPNPFKLSVFLGSPKTGLEDVRLRLMQAILEAGHIPDGMELWAAGTRPTLQTIALKLHVCDVHILVLGHRYGTTLVNEKISYTEWEYRQSRDAFRPVISFLLDEDAVIKAWAKDPPTQEEKDNYSRFREELQRRSVCKFYKNQKMPQIDRDVLNALNEVIDQGAMRPHAGWIRAESKAARVAGALQDNPFLMRIMDRVVRFQDIGSRIHKESCAKLAAAAMFWDKMMNQLARQGYMNIFLESGSSLAYVSEALEHREERQQGWKISTNNALALLQLLLFTDGDVRRNPSVAPDPADPYGAIFTKDSLRAYEEPPVKPRKLHEKEMKAIEEIIALLKAGRSKQLILATASGWDTTHKIEWFQGPHVGSHANMLFKRAIFSLDQPVVLFLTRHKTDPNFPEANFKSHDDIRTEKGIRYCYPVFGAELTLKMALSEVPVALCIGYQKEKDDSNVDIRIIADQIKDALKMHLGHSGFDMEYAAKEFIDENGQESGAIMLANAKFCQMFPK